MADGAPWSWFLPRLLGLKATAAWVAYRRARPTPPVEGEAVAAAFRAL